MKTSMTKLTWARRGGYEVSSKGDERFSAFNAIMPDGRSIEAHYQCDTKQYQPGGTNWRLGKGKPPLNKSMDQAFIEYVDLWRQWSKYNIDLLRELYFLSKEKNYILSDCFASTPINQAHALSIIINELIDNKQNH